MYTTRLAFWMFARTLFHVACGKNTRWTSMPAASACSAMRSASTRLELVRSLVGPTMKTAFGTAGVLARVDTTADGSGTSCAAVANRNDVARIATVRAA